MVPEARCGFRLWRETSQGRRMAEPTDASSGSTHADSLVLSQDERAKVRTLLVSGTPEGASLALSLLHTLDASPADRMAVFGPELLLELVGAWNPPVWEVVFDELPVHRRKMFMAFALLRFVGAVPQRWGALREGTVRVWRWVRQWSPRGTELREVFRRHQRGDEDEFKQSSPWVDLSFVDELHDAVAREIAAFEGDVHLNAVTEITVAQAKLLSHHAGWLYANGIPVVDDTVAVALAKHPSHLFLEGLTSLSHVGLAKKLAAKPHVCLDSVVSITDEAAKALARSGSRIYAKHVDSQVARHRLR